MKNLFTILLLSISLNVFSQSKELKTLSKFMIGSYTSQEQHLKDTTNYFDIRLQIQPIWKKQRDGYWFYVEQAVADFIDKPYRQRVYHLIETEKGKYSSIVYTINEPLRFTHHPELLEKTLTIDSISEKKGCTVFLTQDSSGNYPGQTDSKTCPSDRKGASYATSEVIIQSNELKSWDRGFDDKGEQVWGATLGGYIFKKIK